MVSCPFGAISDKSQIFQTIQAVKSNTPVYVALAPAFVGQFGPEGVPERMRKAFQRLGFADVYEVAIGADLCVIEEAADFLEEVPEKHKFMVTSCCPSWSDMVKKLFPQFEKNISVAFTPMVLTARMIKRDHPDCKVVFVGRSMVRNMSIAADLGYLHIPEGTVIDLKKAHDVQDDKLVFMCTGSQGEPLSALSRMANGEHKTLSIHEGDTVILSATPVPGNEKAVQQVVNSLAKLGCDVWDKNRALVHVSGHGSQEELKLLMAMAKPTYFMPVHGEAVHLRAHAQLARKMGLKDDHIFILDNGDTLEMRGGIVKRGTPVESGVVYVDGLRIGDTDPIVLRDRQKLANDGMVTAVAIVSLKHKKIEAIEFSGRGVSFAIDDQFSEDASASIMKTIEKGKFSFTSSGSDAIRKAVRDSLSNFIWSRTRTRPMIIPVVMEV